MAAVTALFLVFPQYIVSIFTSEPAVQDYAVTAMRVVSAGYIFYGIGMVMNNAFNGAGDTWTPTWINLFGFWLFQIPFAWLLAIRLEMGPQGVFIAMTVAFSMLAIVSGVIFRRGHWKTKQV